MPPLPLAPLPLPLQTHSRPTLTALQAESFDVVVFSLLLSFLPLPLHRLDFCCKAHHLLVLHGVLLVITPDSSHQNKHAAMMKEWKTSIEAIGFHRWKYYKDAHLHCMAFRKSSASRLSYDSILENSSYHLGIPQDKHEPSKLSPRPASLLPDSSQTDCLLSELPFYNHSTLLL